MFACLPLPLKSNLSVVDVIVLVADVTAEELGYDLKFSFKSTEPVRFLKFGIPLPICKKG